MRPREARRAAAVALFLALGAFTAASSGVARADAPPVASEPVSFGSADGFRLHGDLARAADSGAPVAILLHQFNADRRSFAPLVPALGDAGFTVLAFDQRGQGESKTRDTGAGSETVDVRAVAARDRDAVGPFVRAGVGDVRAALDFLAAHGVATDRVVLVGSSYGCSVALLASAELPGVRALALLSPGTGYFGVDVTDLAVRFAGPLALFAADDDAASAESVRRFDAARKRSGEATVFPSGGHGVALLAAHPELPARIARFLAGAVRR